MKSIKLLIIYLLCVFPVFSVCFFMVMFGDVSISYNGFALDSSGVLYIGTDAGIQKYKDEIMIDLIDPKTSRGYIFTITDEDHILLSTASTVYILDLEGNTIDEYDDTGTKAYNYLQSTKRVFATQDGKKYVMNSEFGRINICSDEEMIYQMPVTDYIVKVISFLSGISIFIFAPIIIIKWRKEEEKQSMGESARQSKKK